MGGIAEDQFKIQMRKAGVFLIKFKHIEDYIRVWEVGDTWTKGVYILVEIRRKVISP